MTLNVDGVKGQGTALTSDERTGRLALFAGMAIAGTIGYFAFLSGQKPFNVVFFRCSIGATGLFLYCWHKDFLGPLQFKKNQVISLVLGALTLVGTWYFLLTAYALTSVGIATVVYNVQPFMLIVAGLLFRRERPALLAVVWLLLAFCGVVILAQPDVEEISRAYLLGVGSALIAAALYVGTMLLTKSLSTTMRPEVIAVCHMTIGTLLVFPFTDFHDLPRTGVGVFAIVTLGLFHTCFMFILLYGAYKITATQSLAVLSLIYPLVAVLVDFLAFGSLMSVPQLFGGALIVAAATAYACGFNPRNVIRTL